MRTGAMQALWPDRAARPSMQVSGAITQIEFDPNQSSAKVSNDCLLVSLAPSLA